MLYDLRVQDQSISTLKAMSNLPPLSAASDAVLKTVLAKTIEIQASGDLSLISDGYRICSALAIRSALQMAGYGAPVRAEDILENLERIADNLHPQLTPAERYRQEASQAIELIEDYSTDYSEISHALDSLRSIVYQLTEA
jgi:hypothetical protein